MQNVIRDIRGQLRQASSIAMAVTQESSQSPVMMEAVMAEA